MRLYAKHGNRVNAVRQFDLCRETLDSELGIPPMEETQALYSQILASAGTVRHRELEQMPRADIGGVTHKMRLAKLSADKSVRSLDRIARELQRAKRDMAEASSHIDESLGLIEPGSDPLKSN
jgi:DNA-binding SARP family transcriptional activator